MVELKDVLNDISSFDNRFCKFQVIILGNSSEK